jgi:hypothetical protein
MAELHIGERVSLGGRVLVVRGFTPQSVSPSRVHLQDIETGESLEVQMDKLAAETLKVSRPE